MYGLKELEKAKKGNIVPVYETMDSQQDELDFFKKISDYGKKPHSILLESADIVTKYGEKSIGSADPCLNIIGKGDKFEINALNETGNRFLAAIKNDLKFCDSLKVSKNKISGILKVKRDFMSENEKLRAKTHADILRIVAFKLKPVYKPFPVFAGLFGVIAYDFIDQFEQLPKNKKDLLKEPDYEMNFYENLFLVDHKKKQITFVANALIFNEEDKKSETERCKKIIEFYKSMLTAKIPIGKKPQKIKPKITTDTNKNKFVKIVSALKKNVLMGDVFQVVPSRTVSSTYTAEPLDIYASLRKLNPSPYMFYFQNSSGILAGSSPETFIKIAGNAEKKIEIRPIAGTRPRGFVNGKLDEKLDAKYAEELLNDVKEMAEHTMLIDLARNDVARVSKPGTRECEKSYMIEKYSHVQHIVSSVTGILKSDLDALYAYMASMNMGTLTGAPKVEAMKLIRLNEKTRRGFYGGSIGYLTPSGEFDSAIIIRSMSLQKGKAYTRAGAGIVFDSVPEKEFEESERKMKACLRAIELAEGFK
ncbi:MAG TPA: anthranilate synthase component 1 [archaeon]|nr:anthranilate synthase component 1 [archaeon]